MKKLKFVCITLLACCVFLVASAQADPKAKIDAEGLVDKSAAVISSFAADPNLDWFRKNVQKSKAVLIIPQSLKGAFVVGGSGGSGVLLVRDSATGEWGYPAFYTLGAMSIGFQIGAESSEIVLMVMSERGMESLLTSSFKLGADVTMAVGPIGAGATAKTADIYSFARSKGAFAGVSLDGAVVKTGNKRNNAYYGAEVSPTDILIRKSVQNPQADPLRAAVKAVASQ